MAMLPLIFVVLALVLFLIAAMNQPSRINLVAAGLASYMVSLLLGGLVR